METVRLTEIHKTSLLEFCDVCSRKGYNNNSSLKSMKYDWCLENNGVWYGTLDSNKIISVSGVHDFPEIGQNSVRVLFRGAQISSPYKGLGKHHMNSIPFRDHLPLAIKDYANKDLFLTTNVTHDASGKMNKVHQTMQRLCSLGLLTLVSESMELFYTEQAVWQINKESYLNARNKIT
jgi:hypothetical protein